MTNKFVLEALASDLKRVSLGLQRGSNVMAQRFLQEALKRREEVLTEQTAPYINKILTGLNNKISSEDALMYSTLIQNYTQRKNT